MRAKFAGKTVTFAIAALSGSGKPHRSWRAVHTDAGVFERLGSPERFRNCVSWAARPTSVPSKRVETEDGTSDDAERAKSSCNELLEVVTGDVLHDFTAAAGERAVGESNGDPDDEVAQRAEAQSERAAVVRGEHTADGSFFRPEGIEGKPLAVLR